MIWFDLGPGNYFIISPRLLGTAYADNFTMEFRTAYAGTVRKFE